MIPSNRLHLQTLQIGKLIYVGCFQVETYSLMLILMLSMQDHTRVLDLNLWRYMSPVVLTIGLIGNILSLLVMRFRSMKYSTLSLYLSVLAVSDIGVLLFGLGPNWAFRVHQFNLRASHAWVCKVDALIVHCCRDLSAWILVCVTLERLVIVYLPLRAKILFTHKRTMLTLLLLILTLALINCHFLVTMTVIDMRNARVELKSIQNETLTQNHTFQLQREGFTQNGTSTVLWATHALNESKYDCANMKYSDNFYAYYWTWIDACIASFVPFILIFICNILIVFQLIKAKIRRNLYVTNSLSDDATKSMTVTLIVISIVFLVLTAPAVIVLIVINLKKINDPSHILTPHDDLLITIVYMLEYSNCALNFIMYCISGRKFRESLVKFFQCKKPLTLPDTVSSYRLRQH
ncbi:unnamed protein product [Owenia fusiformis]|uniref:G-protein coupled receptors family 1 profile domain-containing protein n=1 Tax=Owenia fusiformis TaxID=6347 RepID=A0A8S4N2H5_OWEFU|nr:unnamed protein product [Owenia fusiformis]